MTTHQWIDSADGLRQFCESLDDGPVAVDTESDHFHAYQARVCLIQLAGDEGAALVDPLALDDDDLQPLFELLENPAVTKVLHSARNDINELDRDYGVGVNNLFDTQIAIRFLDYEKCGLDWMLKTLLDVETGKAFSRYDWTTRPLPGEALRYAADDVHHLLELRGRFIGELQAEGWLEPFRQQCQYIADSVQFVPNDFEADGWRDLDGASRLDGRGRATLEALYLWRHKLCTRLNRSAVTLLPNGPLLYLARSRPQTVDEVGELRGVPDVLVDDYAGDIIEVIADAETNAIPPKTRPDSGDSRRSRPSREERARYDALRSWRNERASRLGIPTEFVATNATLTKIAKAPPTNTDELRRFEPLLDWHVEMFGDDILEIASGAAV